MAHVYHFTDTAHLPWIMQAGELRPGDNRVGDFPSDFVWATTDPRGARSSTCQADGGEAFKKGAALMVRFTLHAEDFAPWLQLAASYGWQQHHIDLLTVIGTKMRCPPVNWRACAQPIKRDRWIAVDTRSYANSDWRAFVPRGALLKFSDGLGVNINGFCYLSQQLDDGRKPISYAVKKVMERP